MDEEQENYAGETAIVNPDYCVRNQNPEDLPEYADRL